MALTQLLTFGGMGLLLLPLVIPYLFAIFGGIQPLGWVTLAGAFVYGGILLLIGVRVGGKWMDARLPADQRAELLLGQMSTEEKLQLIRSRFGMDSDKGRQPEGALGSAGFVAGIERLGIPAQQLVDAGLGITNPGAIRKGDHATAMPRRSAANRNRA